MGSNPHNFGGPMSTRICETSGHRPPNICEDGVIVTIELWSKFWCCITILSGQLSFSYSSQQPWLFLSVLFTFSYAIKCVII